MLASLIRLRQSQSANKGCNCDRGDMREVDNYCLLLCRRNSLFHFFFPIPPAHWCKPIKCARICIKIGTFLHMPMPAHTHTHTHTHTHKKGTALNSNQTAMSHTVTVATVASSVHTHSVISLVFYYYFFSSLCAAHRHNQLSATMIPALISQVDHWINHWGVWVWAVGVIVQILSFRSVNTLHLPSP